MLRYSEDKRTLGFVMSYFAGQLILWNEVAPLVLRVAVFGWVIVMAMVGAVINHNALHSPVFKRRWMNRGLQVILSFIYGMPVTLFVPVHNLSHHKHSQTKRDVMRSSKLRSKWNLVSVLQAPAIMGLHTLRDDFKYFRVQRTKGAAIYRHLRLELVLLALYAAALVTLDWQKFLLFVFLPWQASQGFIVGINFVQHDGCDDDNEGVNFARNFTGPVFNWFFLNNGYHTIHHRQPGLHWSLTPEAHARLIAPAMHPNLAAPNAATFFWGYFFAPGTRRTYLDEPYQPPEPGDDEAWHYQTTETYSG